MSPTLYFSRRAVVVSAVFVSLLLASSISTTQDLPIDRAALEEKGEQPSGSIGIRNLFSVTQFDAAIRGADNGLAVDFSHVKNLLDGGALDTKFLYGKAFFGPYPFEAGETKFAYSRFRFTSTIQQGKATLYVGDMFKSKYNSERWTDRGQISVRFELFLERVGADRKLGIYETRVAFKKSGKGYARVPTLVEGPFVNLIHSDDPMSSVISFVTQETLRATVVLRYASVNGAPAGGDISEGDRTREFRSERAARRHEIEISGLRRDVPMHYRIVAGETTTEWFPIRAAPAKGSGGVRFGYFGDTREGVGGGMASFMGVNFEVLERLTHVAYTEGAEFLIVGGDLVNGYTGSKEDFEAQLWAWKHAATSFWNERPIYATMGNHEALVRQFGDTKVDRWPYDTESAEAVFADLFVHPRNGPVPSDPRRPTYDENVYSFQYGCVRVIAFNNNYWVSYGSEEFGGAPEGYLLPDQLEWIGRELDRAEADPTVKYIILFAQEPIFPNGGHIADGMWHNGDNRVRAHHFRDGKVLPENDGTLVVRNKLIVAVSQHRKVAAVLGSDEHAYHRILIGPDVPVGDIVVDDQNRNGKIDVDAGEDVSTLPTLRYKTWYVVGGGGGAPYYAEESAPWNRYWADKPAPPGASSGFYYSSQENILFFDANEKTISVRVLNPRGELIDKIDDLMAVKDEAK